MLKSLIIPDAAAFRYIQYETRLEELRKLRKEAAGLAGTKKSLADHALVRRIHFIFERATRKFRGDLALWHAWLRFCKDSRSVRQMSKVSITTPLFPASLATCRHLLLSLQPAQMLLVNSALWHSWLRVARTAQRPPDVQGGQHHLPGSHTAWRHMLAP